MDGIYNSQASSVSGLPPGAAVALLSALPPAQQAAAAAALGSATAARGGVLQTLNAACADDVVVVLLPAGCVCERPIHILHLYGCAPTPVQIPRQLALREHTGSAPASEEALAKGQW